MDSVPSLIFHIQPLNQFQGLKVLEIELELVKVSVGLHKKCFYSSSIRWIFAPSLANFS